MGLKTEQFLKKVDENLVCSICCEVFQDPVSCKDGHTFCSSCIGQWLKTHKTCPLDYSKITDKTLVRNLTVSNIINNMHVYCHPHDKEKIEQNKTKNADAEGRQLRCDWTGKLQSLPKHKQTCPFQEVQCPHVNCDEIIPRRNLEYHNEVCLFKMVMCEDCSFVLIRRELERHRKNDCPEVIILCPNRCISGKGIRTRFKRNNLNYHLTNICSKAVLDCPYKDQGCSVQVERQEVEKHVQENMAPHMMLLAKQCSFLTKQNSSLNKQNSSLTEQCSSLTKKCLSLTEQCSTLTKQCSALASQCSLLTDRCSLLDQRNTELVRELDSVKSQVLKFVL